MLQAVRTSGERAQEDAVDVRRFAGKQHHVGHRPVVHADIGHRGLASGARPVSARRRHADGGNRLAGPFGGEGVDVLLRPGGGNEKGEHRQFGHDVEQPLATRRLGDHGIHHGRLLASFESGGPAGDDDDPDAGIDAPEFTDQGKTVEVLAQPEVDHDQGGAAARTRRGRFRQYVHMQPRTRRVEE